MDQFQIDDAIFQKRLKNHVDKKANNQASDAPPKPKKPTQRRIIVNDATVEALSDVLTDNPRGILSYFDELSGWIGSFDAYRDRGVTKDRANWLELYNGGPRTIDRVKRGTVMVPNWSSSLCGGITPAEFKRVIGKVTGDGLLQRLIVVFGRATGEGQDREPDMSAVSAYSDTIERLLAMSPQTPEDSLFTLASDAQEIRCRVTRLVNKLAATPLPSPPFKAHLGKWEGLFPRLLLTFHLTEAASEGVKPSPIVDGDTAERVGRLMLDFLLPHAARFYGEVIEKDEYDDHVRWIAGHILAGKVAKLTVRDIGRAYRALRGDRAAIERVMEVLSQISWVKPKDARRGQPPSCWEVNPRVHAVFAVRAAEEARRRGEVKARIKELSHDIGLGTRADSDATGLYDWATAAESKRRDGMVQSRASHTSSR
jgi:hypothetical protein